MMVANLNEYLVRDGFAGTLIPEQVREIRGQFPEHFFPATFFEARKKYDEIAAKLDRRDADRY